MSQVLASRPMGGQMVRVILGLGIVVAIALGFCGGLPAPVEASPAASPVVVLYEAHAYRNLLANGDWLILVRYRLPEGAWRAKDCAGYSGGDPVSCMDGGPGQVAGDDITCPDDATFKDPCWVSLKEGMVYQTVYIGSIVVATGLVGIRELPRVGHGLSAIYIGPGHSLVWGNPFYQTCVEGSPTVFSPLQRACKSIFWHPSKAIAVFAQATPTPIPQEPTLETTDNVISASLPQVLLNLEKVMKQPRGTFVNIDKITLAGYDPFVREAFAAMANASSSSFIASIGPAIKSLAKEDFNTKPGLVGIQNKATESLFYIRMTAIAEGLGVNTMALGGGIMGILAVVAVVVGMKYTGDQGLSLLLGFLVLFAGVLLWFVPAALLWLLLAAIILLGGIWLFSKLPG